MGKCFYLKTAPEKPALGLSEKQQSCQAGCSECWHHGISKKKVTKHFVAASWSLTLSEHGIFRGK